MKKLLAENQFTITKKLFYEGMALISRDSYGKFVKKVTIALLGVWLVLFTITLIAKANLLIALGELVLVAFLCAWISVYLPRSRSKRTFKRLQLQGDLTRTTRFYTDHMEMESENRQEEIAYDQVKDILQGQNLVVLICRNHIGVMLALDGFTVGDAEKVRSIIQQEFSSAQLKQHEEE